MNTAHIPKIRGRGAPTTDNTVQALALRRKVHVVTDSCSPRCAWRPATQVPLSSKSTTSKLAMAPSRGMVTEALHLPLQQDPTETHIDWADIRSELRDKVINRSPSTTHIPTLPPYLCSADVVPDIARLPISLSPAPMQQIDAITQLQWQDFTMPHKLPSTCPAPPTSTGTTTSAYTPLASFPPLSALLAEVQPQWQATLHPTMVEVRSAALSAAAETRAVTALKAGEEVEAVEAEVTVMAIETDVRTTLLALLAPTDIPTTVHTLATASPAQDTPTATIPVYNAHAHAENEWLRALSRPLLRTPHAPLGNDIPGNEHSEATDSGNAEMEVATSLYHSHIPAPLAPVPHHYTATMTDILSFEDTAYRIPHLNDTTPSPGSVQRHRHTHTSSIAADGGMRDTHAEATSVNVDANADADGKKNEESAGDAKAVASVLNTSPLSTPQTPSAPSASPASSPHSLLHSFLSLISLPGARITKYRHPRLSYECISVATSDANVPEIILGKYTFQTNSEEIPEDSPTSCVFKVTDGAAVHAASHTGLIDIVLPLTMDTTAHLASHTPLPALHLQYGLLQAHPAPTACAELPCASTLLDTSVSSPVVSSAVMFSPIASPTSALPLQYLFLDHALAARNNAHTHVLYKRAWEPVRAARLPFNEPDCGSSTALNTLADLHTNVGTHPSANHASCPYPDTPTGLSSVGPSGTVDSPSAVTIYNGTHSLLGTHLPVAASLTAPPCQLVSDTIQKIWPGIPNSGEIPELDIPEEFLDSESPSILDCFPAHTVTAASQPYTASNSFAASSFLSTASASPDVASSSCTASHLLRQSLWRLAQRPDIPLTLPLPRTAFLHELDTAALPRTAASATSTSTSTPTSTSTSAPACVPFSPASLPTSALYPLAWTSIPSALFPWLHPLSDDLTSLLHVSHSHTTLAHMRTHTLGASAQREATLTTALGNGDAVTAAAAHGRWYSCSFVSRVALDVAHAHPIHTTAPSTSSIDTNVASVSSHAATRTVRSKTLTVTSLLLYGDPRATLVPCYHLTNVYTVQRPSLPALLAVKTLNAHANPSATTANPDTATTAPSSASSHYLSAPLLPLLSRLGVPVPPLPSTATTPSMHRGDGSLVAPTVADSVLPSTFHTQRGCSAVDTHSDLDSAATSISPAPSPVSPQPPLLPASSLLTPSFLRALYLSVSGLPTPALHAHLAPLSTAPYALLSGDHNPLHSHRLLAALSPLAAKLPVPTHSSKYSPKHSQVCHLTTQDTMPSGSVSVHSSSPSSHNDNAAAANGYQVVARAPAHGALLAFAVTEALQKRLCSDIRKCLTDHLDAHLPGKSAKIFSQLMPSFPQWLPLSQLSFDFLRPVPEAMRVVVVFKLMKTSDPVPNAAAFPTSKNLETSVSEDNSPEVVTELPPCSLHFSFQIRSNGFDSMHVVSSSSSTNAILSPSSTKTTSATTSAASRCSPSAYMAPTPANAAALSPSCVLVSEYVEDDAANVRFTSLPLVAKGSLAVDVPVAMSHLLTSLFTTDRCSSNANFHTTSTAPSTSSASSLPSTSSASAAWRISVPRPSKAFTPTAPMSLVSRLTPSPNVTSREPRVRATAPVGRSPIFATSFGNLHRRIRKNVLTFSQCSLRTRTSCTRPHSRHYHTTQCLHASTLPSATPISLSTSPEPEIFANVFSGQGGARSSAAGLWTSAAALPSLPAMSLQCFPRSSPLATTEGVTSDFGTNSAFTVDLPACHPARAIQEAADAHFCEVYGVPLRLVVDTNPVAVCVDLDTPGRRKHWVMLLAKAAGINLHELVSQSGVSEGTVDDVLGLPPFVLAALRQITSSVPVAAHEKISEKSRDGSGSPEHTCDSDPAVEEVCAHTHCEATLPRSTASAYHMALLHSILDLSRRWLVLAAPGMDAVHVERFLTTRGHLSVHDQLPYKELTDTTVGDDELGCVAGATIAVQLARAAHMCPQTGAYLIASSVPNPDVTDASVADTHTDVQVEEQCDGQGTRQDSCSTLNGGVGVLSLTQWQQLSVFVHELASYAHTQHARLQQASIVPSRTPTSAPQNVPEDPPKPTMSASLGDLYAESSPHMLVAGHSLGEFAAVASLTMDFSHVLRQQGSQEVLGQEVQGSGKPKDDSDALGKTILKNFNFPETGKIPFSEWLETVWLRGWLMSAAVPRASRTGHTTFGMVAVLPGKIAAVVGEAETATYLRDELLHALRLPGTAEGAGEHQLHALAPRANESEASNPRLEDAIAAVDMATETLQGTFRVGALAASNRSDSLTSIPSAAMLRSLINASAQETFGGDRYALFLSKLCSLLKLQCLARFPDGSADTKSGHAAFSHPDVAPLLEVVNLNAFAAQYVVVGHRTLLEALRHLLTALTRVGAKPRARRTPAAEPEALPSSPSPAQTLSKSSVATEDSVAAASAGQLCGVASNAWINLATDALTQVLPACTPTILDSGAAPASSSATTPAAVQEVIAPSLQAFLAAEVELKAGRASLAIPGVDVPFHSSLLNQPLLRFPEKLGTSEDFEKNPSPESSWLFPRAPLVLQQHLRQIFSQYGMSASRLTHKYIPNVTGTLFPADTAHTVFFLAEEALQHRLAECLSAQLASPVLWHRTASLLLTHKAAQNIRDYASSPERCAAQQFIAEHGPEAVLSQMFRRLAPVSTTVTKDVAKTIIHRASESTDNSVHEGSADPLCLPEAVFALATEDFDCITGTHPRE